MLRNKQIPLIYLLLAAAAFIAFWQVNTCGFVDLDDPLYVAKNIHIRDGITTQAIRWAFTTGYASNWHPLTWMSHMLDVQLFGLKPQWHHLTNLLFHIANTLLLFFVFNRMTKAPWKSAFVAALFALHPLHVESVAWVSERKDVLSAFFWMLTMAAYIHYVERGTEVGRQKTEDGKQKAILFPSSVLRYLAVLISFVSGLMAKPMLVTLPFVLFLLDYWPLQRFEPKKPARQTRPEANKQGAGSGKRELLAANKKKGKAGKMLTGQGMVKEEKPADHKYEWALIRPLLREKIPLFALAALSSIVTFIAQRKGGAVGSIEAFSPGVRIANAWVSYIIYIGKTFWPVNLAVYYPHPRLLPLWQALGAVLLLITFTISVIRTAKRFPYLTVGWLWFTGTMAPVMGIVQVGTQAMADRYTYIPLIGLFIMAAWGTPELLKKWRYRTETLFASSALILTCLFIATWIQAGYWRNSIALFDHTLKVTSRSDLILRARGSVYDKLGNYTQAISDFDRAIEINPEYADAYNGRGAVYGKLGNRRQAIADYDRAIQINPEFALAYINRGAAYGGLGNQRQAISDYDRAIEIDPQNTDAYTNRGIAYGELGDLSQAIPDFDRAIEIDPQNVEAYTNRGVAHYKLGNHRQAISDYDRAIEINPKRAEVYYNRGVAHNELGDRRQAIEDMQKAARFDNENAKDFLKSQGMNW
ncbi:MAG: tetratricopeptide repeat protein [Syntrophobacteraceae bacterium]